ncbi:MAG TPA: TadE/TadG family type IV pilus assembly protein [Pyrinomonadaceae bacterium]
MDHLLSNYKKLGRALRTWQAGLLALLVLVAAIVYRVLSLSAPLNVDSAELYDARLPHYSTFTSSFVRSLIPFLVGAVILTFLTYRLANALSLNTRQQIKTAPVDSQSGSSAVEFVLILPALAVLLLMILQIALVVQAKFVVNYAAFCAARSAIVIIPQNVSGDGPTEPRNYLGVPESSNKVEIIQRAAALPLTAISPMPGASVSRGLPILTNPDSVGELIKLAPFDVTPRSMMGQVMLRAPYAYLVDNTAVKVMTTGGEETGNFAEHDWVTVKVQYRYYLAVPFAKKLFGTSYSGNPIVNLIFGTDYYYPIVEQYTLPMDGEPAEPTT